MRRNETDYKQDKNYSNKNNYLIIVGNGRKVSKVSKLRIPVFSLIWLWTATIIGVENVTEFIYHSISYIFIKYDHGIMTNRKNDSVWFTHILP